jgi:hypothetical protein
MAVPIKGAPEFPASDLDREDMLAGRLNVRNMAEPRLAMFQENKLVPRKLVRARADCGCRLQIACQALRVSERA